MKPVGARHPLGIDVLRQLDPGAGYCIADIGCGPGRVTIPLAHAVGPDGEILAMDVQTGMLTRIGEKAKQQRLSNIRLLLVMRGTSNFLMNRSMARWRVMALGEVPEARRPSLIHGGTERTWALAALAKARLIRTM